MAAREHARTVTPMTDFITAATIRALRTAAQTVLAVIGASTVLADVDWTLAGSSAVLGAVASLLTSIATGLPEVPED